MDNEENDIEEVTIIEVEVFFLRLIENMTKK